MTVTIDDDVLGMARERAARDGYSPGVRFLNWRQRRKVRRAVRRLTADRRGEPRAAVDKASLRD